MKFSGVTILQGVEFYIFPIDFEWALQQCSATALLAITYTFLSHHKVVTSHIIDQLPSLLQSRQNDCQLHKRKTKEEAFCHAVTCSSPI